MTFDEYQVEAQKTDQKSGSDDTALTIPILGLVGEAGTLQAEFKKKLRDGDAHTRFADQVGEELGDILWYVANIAFKMNLSLDKLARDNLAKTKGRWTYDPNGPFNLFDENYPAEQQIPRQFEYTYEYRDVRGVRKTVLVDRQGKQLGNELTDNAYEDDGYRFHDVLHLAHAAVLGWSPVFRKLIDPENPHKRRDMRKVDEVEDGGRAQVIEEAIAAVVYEYAARHKMLDGPPRVDWELLSSVKRLTKGYEVQVRSEAEWEFAIMTAFKVWRQVRENDGGTIRGDLTKRSLEFVKR